MTVEGKTNEGVAVALPIFYRLRDTLVGTHIQGEPVVLGDSNGVALRPNELAEPRGSFSIMLALPALPQPTGRLSRLTTRFLDSFPHESRLLPWVASVDLSNDGSIPKLNGKDWIYHVYGREYLPTILELARRAEQEFGVTIGIDPQEARKEGVTARRFYGRTVFN